MQPCEWYLRLARLMVTALFSIAGVWNATPIQWRVTQGGNGHYYDLVQANGPSWLQARDIAAGTFFLGSRGHLATVTSSAEDTFLRVNFGNRVGDAAGSNIGLAVVPGVYAWIGLTDEVVEGTYRWVTGEPFSFANWAPGEPNNLGNEDYVHYFRRDFGAGPLWSWNDSAASPPFSGYGSYFIEFDGPSSPVPEPTAVELLAVGIIWLCSRRQRR